MKHIKQKPNQCWLAAVCMVESLNYKHWSRYYPTQQNKYKTIAISNWQHQLISSLAVWYDTKRFINRQSILPSDDNCPIDLSGKGIIIVGDMYGNHAIAFEDGLIYNPNADKPCTWDEFMKHSKQNNRRWIIKDIQRKP